MATHVLAGDIGGTKTILAIYAVRGPRDLSLVREAAFSSRDHAGLEEVARTFLSAGIERPAAGAFGIAGPVIGDTVVTTNLPWRVEADALAAAAGCRRVRLMNDLETTAYGALFVRADEIHELQPGTPRRGNAAVIAAGTGLGQAILFWDGAHHRPSATEGGHADFAPRDEREIELLRFLAARYERVSYERVLSGPGLVGLFEFLEAAGRPVEPRVRARMESEDPAAVVGQSGLAGTCAACAEAVEMFVSIYGAQAGNLALATNAFAGVYVGGGIVTRLLPAVASGPFLSSFVAKGRYQQYLREVPVRILLNPNASLLGAAHAAADLAAELVG